MIGSLSILRLVMIALSNGDSAGYLNFQQYGMDCIAFIPLLRPTPVANPVGPANPAPPLAQGHHNVQAGLSLFSF